MARAIRWLILRELIILLPRLGLLAGVEPKPTPAVLTISLTDRNADTNEADKLEYVMRGDTFEKLFSLPEHLDRTEGAAVPTTLWLG